VDGDRIGDQLAVVAAVLVDLGRGSGGAAQGEVLVRDLGDDAGVVQERRAPERLGVEGVAVVGRERAAEGPGPVRVRDDRGRLLVSCLLDVLGERGVGRVR
jgi:hypothetical protein